MSLLTIANAAFSKPLPVPPRRISDWLSKPFSGMPAEIRQTLWLGVLLDKIFADLTRSPSFAAMLEQVPELEDVPVTMTKFKKGSTARGHYEIGLNLIGVNYTPERGDYFKRWRAYLLNIIAHEMRHAFQHLLPGNNAGSRAANMELMTLKGFAMEADANAFQATVAWELKEAGISRYWRHFKRWAPGIAAAFEGAVKDDPASLHDGRAQTAAALAWYKNETIVNYYAQDYMDSMREWMKKPAHESVDDVKDPNDKPAAWHGRMALPPPEGQAQEQEKPDAAGNSAPPLRSAFAYRAADGTLQARARYMDRDDLPQGMEYYLHGVTPANRRAMEKMNEEIADHLIAIKKATAQARKNPGQKGADFTAKKSSESGASTTYDFDIM